MSSVTDRYARTEPAESCDDRIQLKRPIELDWVAVGAIALCGAFWAGVVLLALRFG